MNNLHLKSNTSAFKFCFVLLIICIGIIYGCRKENKADQQTTPHITAAKTWYENTYPVKAITTGHLQTQSKNHDLTQWIKPDWQHAQEYIRDNKTVIEIPVDPGAKFGSAMQLNKKRYNPAYSRSYYLLINDGKQFDAYILTIIADSAYVNNDMSKLANNTYRKHDADFTGSVLYFTPKGFYLGGYGYKNGQLVAPETINETTNTPKVQSINGLGNPVTNVMKQECTDWYIVYFEDGVYVSDEYLTTTCRMVDDGTTPGGGGGASPPPPPPCPPGSHTGPPVIRPCIPPVMESSIGTEPVKVNYVPLPPSDGGVPPPPNSGICSIDPPREPCPIDTAKIVKQYCDNLSSAQKETIVSTIKEFKNYNCLTTSLYNSIVGGTSGYTFCILAGSGSASYNSGTKSISFTTDYASTRSDILGHELFHGFQDMSYPGGTNAYGRNPTTGIASPGFPNIEFEQAVFNDILYNSRTAFQRGTVLQQDAYQKWLINITNDFTSYPKLTAGSVAYTNFMTQYKMFLNQFSTNLDNPYNGTAIDLVPISLINILNKNSCK